MTKWFNYVRKKNHHCFTQIRTKYEKQNPKIIKINLELFQIMVLHFHLLTSSEFVGIEKEHRDRGHKDFLHFVECIVWKLCDTYRLMIDCVWCIGVCDPVANPYPAISISSHHFHHHQHHNHYANLSLFFFLHNSIHFWWC